MKLQWRPAACALGLAAIVLVACPACSSTGVASPGPTPPVGSVTQDDSGSGPTDAGEADASVDAAPLGPVNGCMTYDDHTADDAVRSIVWIRTVGQTCWRIKKGQTVTWDPQQTFSAHPLTPRNGSSGSPLVRQGSGSTPYVVTFSGAGTFGFICGFHSDMTGAIEVVE